MMHDTFMAVRKPAALTVLTRRNKWEMVRCFGTPEHWTVRVGSLLPW
jgi:hypothetical protein